MTLQGIVAPLAFQANIRDTESLKKQFKESSWSQSLSLRSVVILHALPNAISKALGHIADFGASLVIFEFKAAFTSLSLGMCSIKLTLGYTITLLPSLLNRVGLSVIADCQKIETRWTVIKKLTELREEVDYKLNKKDLWAQIDKLSSELDTLGYIPITSIKAFQNKHADDLRTKHQNLLNSIGHLSIKLSPHRDVDERLLEKQDSLISKEKPLQPSANLDLEKIFSVMHGDFTGSHLNPPAAKDIATYILGFIQKVRTGKIPHLKEAFAGHSEKLDQIEARFKTILDLQQAAHDCEGDYLQFGQRVVEKLTSEKVISLPSGYSAFPKGHRTYITFTLEEHKGKKWISGDVVNLGEGAEDGLFINSANNVRVSPELHLKAAPLEEVQKSFFWKAFLDLKQPVQGSHHETTELTIRDFNDILLSEWPGGRGSYQSSDRKPQYSGTCEFAPLKYLIQQILGTTCHKPFMFALYIGILEDYISEQGITLDNVHAIKETTAHLARAHVKHQHEWPELAESTHTKLAIIDQGVKSFEVDQKAKCADKKIDCTSPSFETHTSPIKLSGPSPEVGSKFTLNPPDEDLNARLQYYLTLGRASWKYDLNQRTCILRRGLEEVPSSKDPVWKSDKAKTLKKLVQDLADKFRDNLLDDDSSIVLPANIGPDDAALLFKAYFVKFKIDAKEMGSQAVKEFYLARMKAVFESNSLYLLRPTRPDILADFAETVDDFLHETQALSPADNTSFFKFGVSSVSDLSKYPHLNYLYQEIKKSPKLRDFIDEQVKERRSDTKKAFPITDLDRVEDLYNYCESYHMPGIDHFTSLRNAWAEFFSLFGIRTNRQQRYSFAYFGSYEFDNCHRFYESFQSPYSKKLAKSGCGDTFPNSGDDPGCQRDLFVETYPGLEAHALELLPVLKKELPFKELEKSTENEHLLQNEGIEIEGERLPFDEVQSLLGITTYKDLSIDLLVKHFDRYFPRMKKASFCSLFQAFLTQVFFEEGNTHSLLAYTAEHHPEQILYLLEFLQRRRSDSMKYRWDETTSFLFWMEGVALSYLVRQEKHASDAQAAYQSFLQQTRCLFEREGRLEFLQELSGRLASLTPYFEKTNEQASFSQFVHQQVHSLSDSHDRPLQERRKLDHALYTNQNSNWNFTRKALTRKVNTPAFQGTYTRRPITKIECPGAIPFCEEDNNFTTALEFFISEDERHGLFFKRGETTPSYLRANGKIELLENGEKTGLTIATNHYNTQLARHFGRISLPKDLYIWMNASNQAVRVDYPKLDLSFHFEANASRRNDGRWMSSCHPGYYLDSEYQSYLFEPSDHYLVLRNNKGERIIYTIDASFKKISKDNTLTKLNSTEIEREKARSLLVYHLDSQGDVDFSKLEHEELIYGMYLALREKNYEKAGLWLQEWEKQRPLHSDKTLHALRFFLEMTDIVPRTVTIRMKLILSLLNDPLYDLSQDDKDEFIKQLKNDFFSYQIQKNNTFPFTLSEDEKSQLAIHMPDLRELLAAQKLEASLVKQKALFALPDTSSLDFESFGLEEKALENCPPINLALRPQDAFVTNFLSYYQLAKSLKAGDPRQAELDFLLRAAKYDPSSHSQFGCRLLKCVLDYPYFFPSVEEILRLKQDLGCTNQEILLHLWQTTASLKTVQNLFNLIPLKIEQGKCFLEMAMHKLPEVLAITFQVLLLWGLVKIPSTYFGPFGALCLERSFNTFFRTLLYLALRPAIEWSTFELCNKSSSLKNWIWGPPKNHHLNPTAPKELFSPTVAFNSQLQTPIESLINLQDPDRPYILTKESHLTKEIEAIHDIQRTFNGSKHANREPCVQRQHDQFLEGAQQKQTELEELDGKIKYDINQERIPELIKALEGQKAGFDQTCHEKESLILRIAQDYPTALGLEVQGGLITPLSLDELIIAFGKKDHEKIQRSNPSLSESELTRLEQLIGEYLVAKTASDRLGSALKNLRKAQELHERIDYTNGQYWAVNAYRRRAGTYHDPVKDQREVDALLRDTMGILTAERVFSGAQNPHFLVFEYFMKLTLRKNQVEFLDRLTQAKGDPQKLQDMLEEAHTGFGKSKVAIPLWLFLTTQSGRTAMITVPEPLLEEMRIHLKRVLGKNFDLGISTVYFDRKRANDVRYLKYLNTVFTDAEKRGKCIALSINSLHGLAMLKHKEMYFRNLKEDLPAEHFEELDKIRRVLADRVSNFVDESSDCFYIRYSYDYSVGRKRPLKSSYISTIRTLYDMLIEDEVLLQEVDFDFLSQAEAPQDQEYIDSELYEAKILPRLIEKIIEKRHIPDWAIPAVKVSLSGGYEDACEEYFDTLTPKQITEFSILRKQLVMFFRQSFTCRWNQRYKLGPDRIAYPARQGKLIPNSQFSSLDLIVDFTFQANMRTPFTYQNVENFIEGLIADSLVKSQQEFEATIGYKLYVTLSEGLGLPAFSDLKKEHKVRLLAKINSSIHNRLLFTEGYVLPKLQFYPQKIVSYPHLPCNRTGHTVGGSGTLHDNVPSRFNLNFDYKTIFKNLLVLWQNSQDRVFSIPKLEGAPLVRHLFQNFNDGFNVIIDIAGYFRGFSSSEEIAREILAATARRHPPIEAVGFIDENGRNLILKRGTQTPVLRSSAAIDSDKIFMFYSQEAVVGFDIDLSREARALVTAGRQTRRNFFMQGVGRLRGLNTGMLASFITIEDELAVMRKTLGLSEDHKMQFKDLFLYVFDLEGEQQGDEAFDVMYHEWLAKIEELFWHKDLDMPMEERKALFKKLSSLFCENVFVDPVASLRVTREEMTTDDAVGQALETLLNSVQRMVTASPELAKDYDVSKLRKEFSTGFDKARLRQHYTQAGTTDPQLSFSEVEQEDDRDLELDLDQVKNLDRDEALKFKPEEPQPLKRPYDDLSQYHEVSKFHPDSKQFLSSNILCTENFFKIAKHSSDMYKTTMKPARYSLVVQNRQSKTYKLVLLDLHDAQFIYKQMKENRTLRHADYDYYLIGNDHLNVLAENSTEKWSREIKLEPHFKEVMLEARPYTGKLALDQVDRDLLEDTGKTSEFLKSVISRFVKPWPHFQKSVENYAAPTA